MLKGRPSSRGQVLIIFVFAIIGLIGITGLAIDGGNIYSDRRHAQNAADTAALTAALSRNTWEKANGTCHATINTATGTLPGCAPDTVNNALNIAAQNGYDSNPANQNRVDVYSPPIDGAYSDCSQYTYDCHDYIEVIIKDDVNTWFAKVLGIAQLHNKVEAVALANYSAAGLLFGGNSLVELKPHSGPGCGGTGGGSDVYFGGSGTVTLNGGGVFVNSDNPDCAFKITNTCPTITLNDAIIQGIGGQFPGCSSPVMQHATDPYAYPPQAPLLQIPPSACAGPYLDSVSGIWNSTDNTFHYTGGHYLKLPPDKNTTLEAGVYCVDNLIKTTNSYSFYADGAFLYVKPGGAFNFQGGTIKLIAPGLDPAVPMTAATKPYAGYLIYVDESNWYSTAPNCTINAGSDTVLKGVIYAPHCDMTINGGSGTVGLSAQVIAYTLDLEGSANLIFNYDGSIMPRVSEQNDTGLFH